MVHAYLLVLLKPVSLYPHGCCTFFQNPREQIYPPASLQSFRYLMTRNPLALWDLPCSIKHRGRRLCCTVSVVSSRTYHSTLTHHAPATQTSFVLFKEARLSPVSGLGSCSFTCLAHTSSDLPTAGSPSLFRTQFKCHLLRENRTLRGVAVCTPPAPEPSAKRPGS